MPRLIRDGRLVRPALGVAAAPPELNARAAICRKGVALRRVERGGPAAKAGLQPFRRGDVGIVCTAT